MKKLFFYSFVSFTLLMNHSCKKEDNDGNSFRETVQITVKQGESVNYTLAISNNNKRFNIKEASTNSARSFVKTDNNGSTFVYTPGGNFTGTDVVVVSDDEKLAFRGGSWCGTGQEKKDNVESHDKKGKHRYSEKKEAEHTITFNLIVVEKH